MKNFLFRLLSIFILLLSPIFLFAESGVGGTRDKALMLLSYDTSNVWTDTVVNALLRDAASDKDGFDYSIVQLNSLREEKPERIASTMESQMRKIESEKYKMIVVVNDFAFSLLMEKAERIPESVPIVFVGVEDVNESTLSRHPNITGIMRKSDAVGTLEMALGLYPNSKNVYVLCDSTKESQALMEKIKKDYSAFKDVKFTYIVSNGKELQNEIYRLSKLPKGSLFIFPPWRDLTKNDYQSLASMWVDLSKILKHPCFVMEDTLVGYGTIGGSVNLSEKVALQAADLVRSAREKEASKIPMVVAESNFMADYEALIENKADISRLPSGTELRNRPHSFWEDYSNIAMRLLVMLAIVLIVAILYARVTKRSLKRLKLLLKSMPGTVLIVDEGERVLYDSAKNSRETIVAGHFFLRDIEGADYARLSEGITHVFKTSQSYAFDYELEDVKRSVSIAPISNSFFGCKAVVCFTFDNSELLNAERRASEMALKLAKNTKMWNSFVNMLPMQVFVKNADDDFKYLFYNNAGYNFTGLCESDILGKTDRDIFPEKVAQQFRIDDEATMRGDDLHIDIVAVPDKFGNIHYLKQMKCVVESENGNTLLMGAGIDITDLEDSKRKSQSSAAKLKSTMALWDSVINAMPFMFFVKDADDDFRYMMCNNAYAEFLGLKREDIVGKRDSELSKGVEKICGMNDLETMREGRSSFEFDMRASNGRISHLSAIKKAFVGDDGRSLLIGAASDVSQLYHMIKCERVHTKILSKVMRGGSFDDCLDKIAKVMQEELGTYRIVLANVDAVGVLHFYKEWLSQEASSVAGIDVNVYKGLWDTDINSLSERDVARISDADKDDFAHVLKGRLGLESKALMAAPIVVDGVVWGVLFVSYGESLGEFDRIDENVMRSCANVIALAQIREEQRKALVRADLEKQLILENINIPISLHDASGRLVNVNSAACKMTNETKEEILKKGRHAFDNLGTDAAEALLRRILEGEISASRLCKYNGREFMVYANAVFDESGILSNIIRSAVDVTDINELVRNDRVVNECLDILLSENDMHVAISKALKAICDYLGASRACLFEIDDNVKTLSCISQYVTSGRDKDFGSIKDKPYSSSMNLQSRFAESECILIEDIRSDGEKEGLGEDWLNVMRQFDMRSAYAYRIMFKRNFWGFLGVFYEGKIHHLKDSQKKFLRSLTHFVELILAQHENKRLILAALEKARAADKAKSYFIASVSHEIRTPLNAVIGLSEVLRTGNIPKAMQTRYLDSIAYSGNALLQLINDVLDLSKLEAEQMKIVNEPANLAELIEEVVKVFSLKASERGLDLKTEYVNLPLVEIDKLRIRQILFNLIGNSVKFTNRGYIKVSAEFVETSNDSGDLFVVVRDTGIGISNSDTEKIMEPFVQLSRMRGTNASNKGTGLGLPICKRLAEKMGGEMWIKSEVGKGCSVGITLKNVKFVVGSELTNSDLEQAKPEIVSDSDVSVMLVDDVESNLEVMRAMCEVAGVSKVSSFTSAKEALRVLKQKRFDIVMTDMWMPEMNGAEFAEAMKADDDLKDIPIIAVTADVEVNDNFPMGDFSEIILKPVTFEKIQKALIFLDKK